MTTVRTVTLEVSTEDPDAFEVVVEPLREMVQTMSQVESADLRVEFSITTTDVP